MIGPAALGNSRFRWLLLGQAAAVVGEQLFAVAITVSVLSAGGDAVALGLVLAARGVALVAFLPVGGVWADRLPRRRLLITAYAGQALLAGTAAVLGLLLGALPVGAAAVAVLLSGLAEAFVRPAFNALLQGVLRDDERVSGRSLVSVAVRTGVMTGPAVCVGVIALSGLHAAYLLALAVFTTAVLTLTRLGEPAPGGRAARAEEPPAGAPGERPSGHERVEAPGPAGRAAREGESPAGERQARQGGPLSVESSAVGRQAREGESPAGERVAREEEPAATGPAARGSFVRDIGVGVAEARRRPWVRAILVFSAVNLMLVIAPTQVLLPVVTTEAYGSPAVYGMALTCYGAGGLAGGLVTMAWRPRRPGVVALGAITLYALAPLSLVLAPPTWAILAAFAVAGAGVETYAIHWEVALQREIPAHLIGRISAFAWLCGFGLMPFGQALTGPLAGLAGPGVVLVGAAAVMLLVPPALLLVDGMPQLRSRSAGS